VGTLPDLLDEARRLTRLAIDAELPLALLGGVGVRLLAGEVPPALDRVYQDLDFAVAQGAAHAAERLLCEAGYEPAREFNAVNGRSRLLLFDPDHRRQVDVFVGSFRMCHEIPFANRLVCGQPTVPLAELLLTKLQIVELNEKDVRDTLLLLHGHEVSDHDADAVNGGRIAELCARDWGIWRTITANLSRCAELLGNYPLVTADADRIRDRIGQLLTRIEQAPRSRAWNLRARIGERKRWYELPEEVDR
jgi:hypothetical protein